MEPASPLLASTTALLREALQQRRPVGPLALAFALLVAAALLVLLLCPVEQCNGGGFADVLVGKGARFTLAPIDRLV